jgi:hypothetical protein
VAVISPVEIRCQINVKLWLVIKRVFGEIDEKTGEREVLYLEKRKIESIFNNLIYQNLQEPKLSKSH